MFHGVSEAVLLDAVAVAFTSQTTDEVASAIDEKHGIGNVVFPGNSVSNSCTIGIMSLAKRRA